MLSASPPAQRSRIGTPPPQSITGLFHLAILDPTWRALADALRRLIAAGIRFDGPSDHDVSEALYLRNPDDNRVELDWDRPMEDWSQTSQGKLAMVTHHLDLVPLLKEAETEPNGPEVEELRKVP